MNALSVVLSAFILQASPGEPSPTAQPGASPSTAAGEIPVENLVGEADAAYARRDEPGALDVVKARLELADRERPNDYGVLWRLARFYVWVSDDPNIPDKEKSRLGKTGWDIAERAIKADPSRVEGWYYCAADMGNYSLGIGIFAALGQGIEGKFKDRLSHAEKINPGFEGGLVPTAWGRFYYKLPWPKYDPGKSERELKEALRMNPDNVRAKAYLADLYESQGDKKKARQVLEEAASTQPGHYDAPEERRYQEVARKKLAHLDGR